nr:hypothetical protein CFP56_08726 [Quercus suber]
MALSLSKEEQEELSRSKKKVKDVRHAGFRDGHDSGPSSPNHWVGPWNQNMSFKNKLVAMEDDAKSDEEVENLRQGLVAVKFSRDFKHHIRGPWAQALIVKIGNSIGNVLSVNTFTASKSRGRFVRLCIQVDVEKPLVTAILIGKHEQSISYKGIQKLCFGYGRLGHRHEACLYVIRWATNLEVVVVVSLVLVPGKIRANLILTTGCCNINLRKPWRVSVKEAWREAKKYVVGTLSRSADTNGGGYPDIGKNSTKNGGDDSSVGFSTQPDNGI